MPIRKSAADEVRRLVAEVSSGGDTHREAALARLAVIGARAVPQLVSLVSDAADVDTRVAALQVLEGIDDDRSLDAALRALASSDSRVALAAVAVLSNLLDTSRGTRALDAVTALAVDVTAPTTIRLAAIDTLSRMPPKLVNPLWSRLREDPDETIRARTRGEVAAAPVSVDPVRTLSAVADGASTGADELRRLIADAGAEAPLPTLHRLLAVARTREEQAHEPQDRAAWLAARGSIHQALARRDSRVGLYDLRESVEAAEGPLPVEFVAALETLGDASCVEPIAAALARAEAGSVAGTDWWRQHLGAALRSIVARERLTPRHAVVRRIRTKWPVVARQLFRADL